MNSLVIVNDGDLPLLVCAGTIVKGGNQDRQIGQDIVVAAGTKVPVDAFCVEPGRWTNVREGVANSGEFVALRTMTAKDVRVKGQYENDQSGVWQQVAEVRTRALPQVEDATFPEQLRDGASVQTTTLVDAIDKVDETTRVAREHSVATIVERFDALAGSGAPPVGFAYAVNGEPQSVRVFAHDRLLRRNLEAFANTMVLEAEVAPEASFTACDGDAVVQMVREIEKDAQVRRERTAASNVNVLLNNRAGFNGNCLVEDPDGKEVPVTQDWTRK